MAGRLDGKCAFVAGAGAGIGAAIARRFAAEGARVMCADLDAAAARRTAGEIAASGGTALAARCDVSLAAEVRAALDEAHSAFHRIDAGSSACLFESVRRRAADDAWSRCGEWRSGRFMARS